MAPRANWKGYLRLSLVSCPIALYPASSLSEKVSLQSDQPKDRQPIEAAERRFRNRRRCAPRGHGPRLRSREGPVPPRRRRGDRCRADRKHPDHRNRSIRSAQRDRRPLYRLPLLHRSRRQGWAGCLRGDSRHDSQNEHGCRRPGRADAPRTHHRARGARPRSTGTHAALSLRSPRRKAAISRTFPI